MGTCRSSAFGTVGHHRTGLWQHLARGVAGSSRCQAGAALVAAVVAEINQAMSPYLEQSELSVFNRTETGDWQNCSRPLADVAVQALRDIPA
jgi:thiamine biosynthesis lipoprotein ApbE